MKPCTNLKKLIAITWIILTVIMGYFAFQLPSILTGSGFEMEGSYADTQKILEEEFDQSANSIILLFEKDKMLQPLILKTSLMKRYIKWV